MTGGITLRAPVTVQAPTPIQEAAGLMDRAGVGSLLVIDEGRLAGIVTDRDLALRAVARAVPPDARIDAVMTCGVVTVGPSAGWAEITRVFAEHAVVVRAAVGNGPKRDGEILEVATPAGDPPFLVRWSDGRLSYLYPGPDARIHHYGEPVGSAR